MKYKAYTILMLVSLLVAPLKVMSSNKAASLFFEVQAFAMVFNNYDETHRISVWEDMKLPTKQDKKYFWGKKTGIVSPVLFQSYEEDGKEKVFLLTKTIPVGIPFGCHACLPLLSAIVFVYDKEQWQIESKNLFLMFNGEYGVSPRTKLISFKNNKHGVLLEFEHRGNGLKVEKILLMPKGEKIDILQSG